MEFITKKTSELTEDELLQLKNLFEEVFERPSSVDGFLKYYSNNYLGYSYHTLIINENKIVGSNTLVPINYVIDGKTMRLVNSGGTMISHSCRGIENFYDMIKESYRNAKSEGFSACTGFPNDNSYMLFKGTRLMKDIGKMYTYMLPYRVGGLKRSLKWLNPLSRLFCRIYISFSALFASRKVSQFRIHKEHESFEKYRYADSGYTKIDIGNSKAVYKVTVHEGIRTAFIVDVKDKSPRNFQRTVNEIIKRDKSNVDLILYVGNLPFRNHGLIKLPRKNEPKNFNFTGQLFDESFIDEKVFFDFGSWDVNLSNYDLI